MSDPIDNPNAGDESNEDRAERNERRREAVPGYPSEAYIAGELLRSAHRLCCMIVDKPSSSYFFGADVLRQKIELHVKREHIPVSGAEDFKTEIPIKL